MDARGCDTGNRMGSRAGAWMRAVTLAWHNRQTRQCSLPGPGTSWIARFQRIGRLTSHRDFPLIADNERFGPEIYLPSYFDALWSTCARVCMFWTQLFMSADAVSPVNWIDPACF